MASLANSPKNAFSTVTNSMAKANCRLVVDQKKKTFCIKAGSKKTKPKNWRNFFIAPDTELIYDYGDSFVSFN